MTGGLKHLTVWLLVGTAVFLGVQAFEHRAKRAAWSVDGAGVVTLQRAPDGHYHWPGRVNGIEVDFLIDTGATGTTLPASLAKRAGIEASGAYRSSTAGGTVVGQTGRADVELRGGPRIERLAVGVLPTLETPLLGMNVLSRLKLTQEGGALRIEPLAH